MRNGEKTSHYNSFQESWTTVIATGLSLAGRWAPLIPTLCSSPLEWSDKCSSPLNRQQILRIPTEEEVAATHPDDFGKYDFYSCPLRKKLFCSLPLRTKWPVKRVSDAYLTPAACLSSLFCRLKHFLSFRMQFHLMRSGGRICQAIYHLLRPPLSP